MTADKVIRAALLKAGVRNLKEFGYPQVTEVNILHDDIFRRFFHSMLKDNLGKGTAAQEAEIKKLLAETDASNDEGQI